MDYERIQKSSTQGGGISPSKLRLVLLGSDKRRKDTARRGDQDDEEIQSRSALRSQDAAAEIEARRSSVSDTCKDLDVVSSYPECAATLRQKQPSRSQNDDDSLDTDSVSSSSGFEFQRSDRASQRQQASSAAAVMAPFSKPAPSKWDDAQKWIASPTSTRQGKVAQTKRGSLFGYGSRSGNATSMAATKVVVEVGDEPDTKRMDQSQQLQQPARMSVEWAPVDPYSADDHYSNSKPGGGGVFLDTSVADHAAAINLSQHDPSLSAQPAIGFVAPPSTVRSVSMRDMGTEMTPIASQEPSRTGTPARASTPIRSPSTSRPSSPGKTAAQNAAAELLADGRWMGDAGGQDVSDKELKQIREEIMVLGTKLGKPNIAAWASRDDDDDERPGAESVGTDGVKTPENTAIEMRAAAWEEAEKAKYLARFKREEIKIQAWENHQKAKAEAQMRKTEVEVERMRAEAHERLMNRLASARHKAEEKRASAEARRSHHAAKTAQQAEYIRRTGKLPSSFTHCSCWRWSFCR